MGMSRNVELALHNQIELEDWDQIVPVFRLWQPIHLHF